MAASANSDGALLRQAARRRTFAIISHPDAGKTTLTEKFLLYAGAVQEAGAVKSRKAARTAVSDWMALEQQRGISITSTVLGSTTPTGGSTCSTPPATPTSARTPTGPCTPPTPR